MKKIFFIAAIIFIILIVIVLAGAYIFFNPLKLGKPEYTISKIIDKTTVGEEQINFVLYNVKAYSLHNVPFSKNTPKIEFVVDNEAYNTEVSEGKLATEKGEIENEDIQVITSKEEFISILNSPDLKQALQDSVEKGSARIEVKSGKAELLAKGYLSLYEEITGKGS